jgi:chemotaxis protein histidine kinase CheA
MIFRKLGLGAVIISLALLLTSCVEVRGELSVSSAGRINGEIIYSLSKSLAAGVGLNTLADVKNEASTNPEAQIGFCKDAPITEDASNYILKCALKDSISESGDISASVTGSNIVFRYKANLDAASDQTNFGSVSITIRFLDPVISYTENKVGLVSKVDDRTYRISGAANEPMNIEITANLAVSSGSTITVPAPAPSTTTNPTGESTAAVDAANKAAADKAAADLKAKQEAEAAEAKAAADLKAKQDAEAKAAADKAAEELKVKQEAEAKAAADKAAEELKVKQEAEAKAAADKAAEELKVKQEAEEKVAAEKAAADLKAKLEAEAKAIADKAAAELKAKQEAEAKVASEKAAALLKAKQAAEAKAAAAKILAAAKVKAAAAAKAAAAKKTTITCVKGKLTKKVTAVKPVCPKGYKKKA